MKILCLLLAVVSLSYFAYLSLSPKENNPFRKMDDNDYKVFETTKLIIMIRMSMTKQDQTDYVIDIFDEGTIYWFMFD